MISYEKNIDRITGWLLFWILHAWRQTGIADFGIDSEFSK
jgi:hypothetical protein